MNQASSASNSPTLGWRLPTIVLLLIGSIIGTSLLSHGAPILLRRTLDQFPVNLGRWSRVQDLPIDAETQKVLGATDLMDRVYADPLTNGRADLFIGFFANQRKGGAIHSPKNCLPGAGWEPVKNEIIPITIAQNGETVRVNEYLIQNGLQEQMVIYWYQSQGETIASEYSAKFRLIWNAIRKNRTDGALVRVITPVRNGDERGALDQAISFIQASFVPLADYLPN